MLAGASSGQKSGKRNAPAPYALLAGTVFRPPGFALPGARVEVKPVSELPPGVKAKDMRVETDSRGEFAIRVPPVPMQWTVNVQASGYRPQARTVSVEGEHRVNVNFTLEPEGR